MATDTVRFGFGPQTDASSDDDEGKRIASFCEFQTLRCKEYLMQSVIVILVYNNAGMVDRNSLSLNTP